MADIWLPGYTRWELPGVPGIPYDEWDDPKALLHMTQGTSIGGAVQAYKAYPPHTIVNPFNREKAQHIPLNRAAYALWNADADDSRCYQVEIVGYSENAPNLSDAELKWLGEEVLLPLHEYGGVPLVVVWKGFKAPSDVNYMLATSASPLRLTQAELDSFAGILGHQHIPGDNHWDPGGLNVPRMIQHAKNKLTGGDDAEMLSPEAQRWMLENLANAHGDRSLAQAAAARVEGLAKSIGEAQNGPATGEQLQGPIDINLIKWRLFNLLFLNDEGTQDRAAGEEYPFVTEFKDLVASVAQIKADVAALKASAGSGE